MSYIPLFFILGMFLAFVPLLVIALIFSNLKEEKAQKEKDVMLDQLKALNPCKVLAVHFRDTQSDFVILEAAEKRFSAYIGRKKLPVVGDFWTVKIEGYYNDIFLDERVSVVGENKYIRID